MTVKQIFIKMLDSLNDVEIKLKNLSSFQRFFVYS